VVKGGAQITTGFVPPLQKDKLPGVQGSRKPVGGATAMAHKSKVEVPKPLVHVHSSQKMSTGTCPAASHPLPPPTVPTSSTGQTKANDSLHAHKVPGKSTTDTKLQQMASSTSTQDEKVHQKPISSTSAATGAIAKSSLASKGLTKPIQPPHREDTKRSSDIGLLARIVGLTPSGLTQQTKRDLVGEIIHTAARDAVPTLAPQGTITRPHSPKDEPHSIRPKTPNLDDTVRWAAYRSQEEAKKTLEEREERKEKSTATASDTRPLRSNFAAKPILAPPKLSLERQIQKQLKEDKIKNKLDLLQKNLLDEENKQAQKKK